MLMQQVATATRSTKPATPMKPGQPEVLGESTRVSGPLTPSLNQQKLSFQPDPQPDVKDPSGLLQQVSAERASQPVFTQAFKQRKAENLQQLQQYQKSRNAYYKKHITVLETIEQQLLFKINEAGDFFTESLKYYSDLQYTYGRFWEGLEKMKTFEKLRNRQEGTTWYTSMEAGISRMLSVKDGTVEKTRGFEKWLGEALIKRLKQAFEAYQQTVKSFEAEIDRIRELSAQNDKACFRKLERIQKLSAEQRKFDLMFQEMQLMELYNRFKQSVSKWGDIVHLFWVTVQKNETKLLQNFKYLTNEFVGELLRVFQPTHQLEDLKSYWETVELDHEPQFSYMYGNILKPSDNTFIEQSVGRQIKQFQQVASFLRLQHEPLVLPNPRQIPIILSLKKFACKLDLDKNQKRWVDCSVYSTIDGYLVFFVEELQQLRNQMLINRLQNERLTEQIVCVKEVTPGLVFSSKNREWLHFSKLDDVQEFMFVTESSIEKKQLYLLL